MPSISFTDKSKQMVVKGKILFPEEVGLLPSGSCLRISLEDVSLADSVSRMVKNITIDMSGRRIGKTYDYSLKSFKPIEMQLAFHFAMSATLNVGWCKDPSGLEWLRKGDYYSDSTNSIDLTDKTVNDVFKADIEVKRSGR